MNLQTQIPLQKQAKNTINYQSKIVLLGSCFSENIGKQLDYFKLQTTQNPFGILFHPKAIESLITNAINEKVYAESDLVFQNERWHSLDAHSALSSTNAAEVLNNLNKAITNTRNALQEATHIVITLGTSWVYRFIETDTIVANCHKVPQKKFLKELLSVDEISESLEGVIALVQSVNPAVNIIFTVSPVRHIKDGFTENTVSKSHLISAINIVLEARKQLFYFPSYEIMMDELRDYRFYAEDMIHPNKTAIFYIWQRFASVWVDENANATMQEIDTIQKGMNHRSFNENSEQHQKFLKNLQLKIKQLTTEFPFIKF